MASDRSDDRISRLLSDAAPREVLGVGFDAVETGVVQRRRRQALVGSAAVVALVLGGGTVLAGSDLLRGDDRSINDFAVTPSGAPTGGPTGAPTTAPTAPPSAAVVRDQLEAAPAGAAVAVAFTAGSAEVVWLDGSTARSLGELQPPDAQVRPVSVTSFGSGDAARRCVVWQDTDASVPTPTASVVCHRGRDTRGTTIAGIGTGVTRVALSDDGRRLAWLETRDSRASIHVGDLGADGVSGTVVIRSGVDESFGLPEAPLDVAWVDGETLALSIVADSDEGRFALMGLDRASVAKGWRSAQEVTASDADAPYERFEAVVSAGEGFAYAVQRERWMGLEGQTSVASRAVRIALPGGAVLEVLGTADRAAGRALVATSASGDTAVYTTREEDGGADAVFYVRRSGDGQGTPITGLPDGTVALQL